MPKSLHALFEQKTGLSNKLKQIQQMERLLRGKKGRDVIREQKSTTLYRGTELLDVDYDEYDEDEEQDLTGGQKTHGS